MENEEQSSQSEHCPFPEISLTAPSLPTEQSVPEPPSSPDSTKSDDECSSLSSELPCDRLWRALGDLDTLLADAIYPAVCDLKDSLATQSTPRKHPATEQDQPEPKKKNLFHHTKIILSKSSKKATGTT